MTRDIESLRADALNFERNGNGTMQEIVDLSDGEGNSENGVKAEVVNELDLDLLGNASGDVLTSEVKHESPKNTEDGNADGVDDSLDKDMSDMLMDDDFGLFGDDFDFSMS